MPSIKYVGSSPSVDIPALGLTVAIGEVIEVDDERAAEMAQQDCWELAKSKAPAAAPADAQEG